MNAGFLDVLTQTYVNALIQGFSTLHTISLVLFGALASIAWGANFIMVIQANLPLGAILAQLCLVLVSLAVHVCLINNMYTFAIGLFHMFAGFGASVTGGAFNASQFLSPSTFWTLGFAISRPLIDFILNMSGWTMVRNIGPVVVALLAVLIIVGAFLWISKDIILTIIETHICIMVLPVLFPWAILTHTAEFAALGISWLLGCCIRALLIIAAVGIGAPLMQELVPMFTLGGDPTLYSSLVLAGSSLVFLFITNEVIKRAAQVAGRGYALGLPGAALVPPSVLAAAGALLGGAKGAVITGASRFIQNRRGS